MHRCWLFVLILASQLSLVACSGRRYRPCFNGGEPPRAEKALGDDKIEKRQCEQVKGPDGKLLNEGLYKEWYWNGNLALEGDYKDGKRHGKWFEYDEKGRLVSERWFENGVETATRTSKRPPGTPPAELPPATQPRVVTPSADRP